MFHNNDNDNGVGKNLLDTKEIYNKHIDEVTSSFCPIIFIDKKEPVNWTDANTIESEILLSMNNIYSTFKYNLKELPNRYLYSLEDANRILTINIIINRIKEESIMSIMSYIDNLDVILNNMFLKFFNLREAIDVGIRNTNTIDEVVHDFYASRPFDINNLDEESIENTKILKEIFIKNILAALIYEVNCAIDRAIDDVIFRIHIIPNIMELKEIIIKKYNVPKDDQNNNRFWILADISIKQGLSLSLNENVYPIINKNIESIIDSSVGTSYYIYNNTLAEKRQDYKDNK